MSQPSPCWKCGSTNIDIWDCGYSAFNVGGAKCNGCGHEVKLDICGPYPREDIIAKWNSNKKTFKKSLENMKQNVKLMEEALKNARA